MNIQILQGMVHAGEGRLDSGKEKTAESSPSVSNVTLPGIKDNAFSSISNLPKKQIDLIEFSYPPFFPLGDTQGIYSVLSRPKSDNSSSDYLKTQRAALEEHDTVSTKRIAEQNQHKAALDKNKPIRNNVPDGKNLFTPGSFLDLRV
jgi:hypothetical protein